MTSARGSAYSGPPTVIVGDGVDAILLMILKQVVSIVSNFEWVRGEDLLVVRSDS